MWQEECANVLFCLKTRVQSNELKVITARPYKSDLSQEKGLALGLKSHPVTTPRTSANQSG
jgi:hypothetical protein